MIAMKLEWKNVEIEKYWREIMKLCNDVEESEKCNWLKSQVWFCFWKYVFIVHTLISIQTTRMDVSAEIVQKTKGLRRHSNCDAFSFCDSYCSFMAFLELLGSIWKKRMLVVVIEDKESFLGSPCSSSHLKEKGKPWREKNW